MMLTPCWPSAGPIGGAGVAAPAWIWSLIRPVTFFFFGGISGPYYLVTSSRAPSRDDARGPSSDLGDLAERQLDRGLPAEDRHQHLELLRLGVDLGNGGGERVERTVGDGHGLADREVDLDLLGGLGLGLLGLGSEARGEHREDLVRRQRHRLVGVPDEPGHTRSVPDGAPRLVREVHPDQDVAGHPNAADDLPLSVPNLDDLFHRNLDLEDEVLHVQALRAVLEVGLDPVLVTGVGVDDVPPTRPRAELGPELLHRVQLDLGYELSGVSVGVSDGVSGVSDSDGGFSDGVRLARNVDGNAGIRNVRVGRGVHGVVLSRLERLL